MDTTGVCTFQECGCQGFVVPGPSDYDAPQTLPDLTAEKRDREIQRLASQWVGLAWANDPVNNSTPDWMEWITALAVVAVDRHLAQLDRIMEERRKKLNTGGNN